MKLRRSLLLLSALLLALLMALTPALAAGWDIASLGDALREAQAVASQADADYEALCERLDELQEQYDSGSEAQQLAVQDELLELMIAEEESYALLDEHYAALDELHAAQSDLIARADLTQHTLTAQGYDSELTITALVDADGVLWDVAVTVVGDERDQAVGEDDFLVQFIGRALPLTTDKKAEEAILLLSDARVTSQAVVDALNTLSAGQSAVLPENPGYALTDPQEIADYLFLYGKLPPNFITKGEAEKLGWDSSYNYVSDVAPGKSIGGDRFGNYEGLLPEKNGRTWKEADCFYTGGKRNACRILFSNDGLVYYTDDHYESFTQMFPSWE